MKKVISIFMAGLLLILPACGKNDTSSKSETLAGFEEEGEKPESELLISNGEFETDLEGWFQFMNGGEAAFNAVDGELLVDVKSTGQLDYAIQLYQDTLEMHKGIDYKITFDARSTIDRSIEARMQINGEDYRAYISDIIDLTSEMKSYTIEFTMNDATDLAPRFALNMGTPLDYEGDPMPPHQIYFDNIQVSLIDKSNKVVVGPNEKLKDINVNQLGYQTDYEKIAVFRSNEDIKGKDFEVINTADNSVAYKGKISEGVKNNTSKELNFYGDFSSVKDAGTYIVKAEGLGESYSFKIADDIYTDVNESLLKMLYMQRCGMKLEEKYAGDFAHESCHDDLATIYGTDEQIDVTGGWHDAGDYGRYVVPGEKTIADLLLAYEFNPSIFTDNIGIPESGNGVPDILDEARYELEWMFKMQDAKTGGVYHKVTCEEFPGNVMPEDETEKLVVSPISHAATADFAAVMAMSYTTYKDIDADFANKCLDAAKKAWEHVGSLTKYKGFKNPASILTGEYGDGSLTDEVAWASIELYKITGEQKYHDKFKENYNHLYKGFGWADVGGYGAYTYLTVPQDKVDADLREKIMTSMKSSAEFAVTEIKKDGYNVSMGSAYPWGSNMSVANDAMLLILMDKIEQNDSFITKARSNVNYVFGTNPMSISYVTGFGSNSPVKTHHRPSTTIGKTLPGMLVGGPNSALEDPYSKSVFKDTPPAKCYVDYTEAYSVNEITIYWNSPLIFVISNIK